MIIQLHISESDAQARLERLGYKTEVIEKVEWRNNYHNRDELTSRMILHVVLPDGTKVPALEYFEGLMDEALMGLLAKQNETENKI